MQNILDVSYGINENDEIVFVCDNWNDFALRNDGWDATAEYVVGRRLWDFISDRKTRHLYKSILHKVRCEQDDFTFNFRCDSPDETRYMEMSISPGENKDILFQTKTLSVQKRQYLPLLDRFASRINGI